MPLATTQLTRDNILNAVPVPIFFTATIAALASGGSLEILPIKANTAYLILRCCVSIATAGAMNIFLHSSTAVPAHTVLIAHAVVGPQIVTDTGTPVTANFPSGICLVKVGEAFTFSHDLGAAVTGRIHGVMIEIPS